MTHSPKFPNSDEVVWHWPLADQVHFSDVRLDKDNSDLVMACTRQKALLDASSGPTRPPVFVHTQCSVPGNAGGSEGPELTARMLVLGAGGLTNPESPQVVVTRDATALVGCHGVYTRPLC